MSVRFRSINRSTPYLLPPSIDEWLPDSHLARFVVDVVNQLDTSEIERSYSDRGSDPWHPKLLIALLFYGYESVGLKTIGCKIMDCSGSNQAK